MANFNKRGTIILGKGSWWIAYSLQGGGGGFTLVQGTLAQVKTWSMENSGNRYHYPGTRHSTLTPLSGAGFRGSKHGYHHRPV